MQVSKNSFVLISDPIQIFQFVINVFNDFGYNFVAKKINIITYFRHFLFFVYLLPCLNHKWPITTLSVFEEGANEYILRADIWLDGFDSVFWQVSIEFLFVVFCCSFSLLK